jgi:type I restriction enzyme S subunit
MAAIAETGSDAFSNAPADWKSIPLSEMVTADAPICYGIVQVGRYVTNGIPVLAIKNLNTDYRSRIHCCHPDIEAPYARSRVQPDDVVISIKGTVGRIGIVPNAFFGNISRDLARLRFSEGFLPNLCFHMLRSPETQRRLAAAVVGTTRMELSIAVLRQFRVLVPLVANEQKAISEALSDIDDLIQSLERLIAKKRDLKQAAMQQLLTGQTRLPGFSGEWRSRRLGDVARIKTGSRNNEDKICDGVYPFFVRSDVIERINTFSHECEAILVPGEGRIGSIFHYINGRFDVHQRVYAITDFAGGVDARFVHAYMSQRFGAWAMTHTVKATVDSLRLPTFQNFVMVVPPTVAEQRAIAEVLSDMDAEITALEARLTKTRDVKQGMMQELLTGRTRLV